MLFRSSARHGNVPTPCGGRAGVTPARTPGPGAGQMPRSSALAGAGRTPGGNQPTLVDGQWAMILPSPSPGPGSFVTHPSTYPKRLGDRLRQGRSNQRPGRGRCRSTHLRLANSPKASAGAAGLWPSPLHRPPGTCGMWPGPLRMPPGISGACGLCPGIRPGAHGPRPRPAAEGLRLVM